MKGLGITVLKDKGNYRQRLQCAVMYVTLLDSTKGNARVKPANNLLNTAI